MFVRWSRLSGSCESSDTPIQGASFKKISWKQKQISNFAKGSKNFGVYIKASTLTFTISLVLWGPPWLQQKLVMVCIAFSGSSADRLNVFLRRTHMVNVYLAMNYLNVTERCLIHLGIHVMCIWSLVEASEFCLGFVCNCLKPWPNGLASRRKST